MMSKRKQVGHPDPPLQRKRSRLDDDDDDDDDNLSQFIRSSIASRDAKLGSQIVKNANKKKGTLAKGELGGGSFQSMGT